MGLRRHLLHLQDGGWPMSTASWTVRRPLSTSPAAVRMTFGRTRTAARAVRRSTSRRHSGIHLRDAAGSPVVTRPLALGRRGGFRSISIAIMSQNAACSRSACLASGARVVRIRRMHSAARLRHSFGLIGTLAWREGRDGLSFRRI